MEITEKLGMKLLGVYLILIGLLIFLPTLVWFVKLVSVLGIAAGAAILLDK